LFRRRFARRRGLILHNRNVITPDNDLATASAMALDAGGFETEIKGISESTWAAERWDYYRL
jgi:hypothetical protein